LHSFLTREEESYHGYEIMKETGLGPGTLYGILKRLHDRGYLDKAAELVGGRCRIRYHLTEAGRRYAKRALVEDEYERGVASDLTLEL